MIYRYRYNSNVSNYKSASNIHIKIVKKSSPETGIASNQISHGQDSTDGVIREKRNKDDSEKPSKEKTGKKLEHKEYERRF